MESQKKGYWFALIATLCGSMVYLFSKAALNQISLAQFGFWWFLLAIFWNSLMAIHPRGGFNLTSLNRQDYKNLIFIGIVEVIATVSFYAAIKITDNPSIPSFLRNLEYLFVTLLGVWLLSERFSRLSGFGASLILVGAFIISFNKAGLSGFMSSTAALMLISTSFYALRTLLVKKNIGELRPVVLALNRALFLLMVAVVFVLISKASLSIPKSSFFNILAGSFIGPFLTSIFQYSALRYTQASRAVIIQSTTGLFVLIGSLIMFGSLPSTMQICGGLFTIAGVSLMMKKERYFKRQ